MPDSIDKPSDLAAYYPWAVKHLSCDFDDSKAERVYETNVSNILTSVTQSDFFVEFSEVAATWAEDYLVQTKSELFMDSAEPDLSTKPYTSVVDKSFRKNVLWNKRFPKPPHRGWVTLDTVYSQLNDLVRGTLVCRFIDGPELVARQIGEYAARRGLKYRSYSQERESGYYAFHAYVSFPVDVFDIEWNKHSVAVEVEIQITTQLQEVLRSLTHHLYEGQRLQNDDTEKWKWEFGSNRFKVGYLSHTLHLLESVIVESRDKLLDNPHTDGGETHG
ncbi:hypothetical protein HRE53_03465 [Acaryochloris sp. 'Moss Beach']|uniref:hypothetical protein n=1 Tax=Acaryochloris sp. 'Moss Beach' TaxID=2740837 RepID=UPI001F42A768|nr:hypothetical protein [Acaryochloris sp. 'Moss Beach']UJB70212.1 hypothetical protein HRE53_03465 [Acaryochloris sp. 'Moss Beach']